MWEAESIFSAEKQRARVIIYFEFEVLFVYNEAGNPCNFLLADNLINPFRFVECPMKLG